MSHAAPIPGLFQPVQGSLPLEPVVPATERQIAYARGIAKRLGQDVPQALLRDKTALSRWINRHKAPKRSASRFDAYPSSKQVAFAERIARLKRRDIPRECFHDKTLMSRWIDGNKP